VIDVFMDDIPALPFGELPQLRKLVLYFLTAVRGTYSSINCDAYSG
jgi:hypothetical protein